MKCEILIEIDYENLGQVTTLVHAIESLAETDRLNIKRITITCLDSDDKPFMTHTPIGDTISAGDAGALAVQRYGSALNKLAEHDEQP
jgi:hypothetical protein